MSAKVRTTLSLGAASALSVSALAVAPAQAGTGPDRSPTRSAVTTHTAQRDTLNNVCTLIGFGTGGAGLAKALAKGATWVGIGASAGCWLLSEAQEQTPKQKRAAMLAAYRDWESKSALEQLESFGLSCRRDDGGGGGGTDRAMAGVAYYKVDGKIYRCTGTRD